MTNQKRAGLFLSGLFILASQILACTSKGIGVGDCVVDPLDRNSGEIIQITQKVDGGYFGTRFRNGEPTGQVTDIDATIEYSVVECPD